MKVEHFVLLIMLQPFHIENRKLMVSNLKRQELLTEFNIYRMKRDLYASSQKQNNQQLLDFYMITKFINHMKKYFGKPCLGGLAGANCINKNMDREHKLSTKWLDPNNYKNPQ